VLERSAPFFVLPSAPFEGTESAFLPAANTIHHPVVGLALVHGDGPRVNVESASSDDAEIPAPS